jgi:SAM-dependent methyltransferase
MDSAATTWGAGDYPRMARALEPAAIAVVDAAQVGAADRVIDVATGTGNAALLAAARGAKTVGVDYEPALLRIAEQRARDAGRDIRWVRGEAHALPLPDRSADVVLSVFGVMYAADQVAAAGELARTAAAGARVVLASWTPGSVMPAMGGILGRFLPPPPAASGPPSRWGDRDALQPLLDDVGLTLTAAATQQLVLDFPDIHAAAGFLIDTAGHVVTERERLIDEGRWSDLHDELVAFVAERADTSGGHVRLTLEYLLVSAERDR